jgi:hypothetical protein
MPPSLSQRGPGGFGVSAPRAGSSEPSPGNDEAVQCCCGLMRHQPALFFSQNKSATSNQPTVLFSQNKPAPAVSHQAIEQAVNRHSCDLNDMIGFWGSDKFSRYFQVMLGRSNTWTKTTVLNIYLGGKKNKTCKAHFH